MSDRVSDFRSDTLTTPTPQMREAMARAEVGDDVYREDPTVRRLEEMAAARFGRGAGLFVPTGTMANQIGIRVFTQPGDEILAEPTSHIVLFEAGAAGLISGVQLRTVPARAGVFDAAAIEAAIRGEDVHFPRTALVCLENTHNIAGGVVQPLAVLDAIRALTRARGIPILLDGARLWNAIVAERIDPAEYGKRADLLWFALSKGLSCPVGSVLVGDADVIERCRKVRKQLGGGMRQVGVLAACGIVALESMVDRLAEDHARALSIAQAAQKMPHVQVDVAATRTNIVMLVLDGLRAQDVVAKMRTDRVLSTALPGNRVRFVTHREVGDADVSRAIAALGAALV